MIFKYIQNKSETRPGHKAPRRALGSAKAGRSELIPPGSQGPARRCGAVLFGSGASELARADECKNLIPRSGMEGLLKALAGERIAAARAGNPIRVTHKEIKLSHNFRELFMSKNG